MPFDKDANEYTDDELEGILSVDNDWAATELADRLKTAKSVLMRCSTILSHMAVERIGFWQRLIHGRWMIAAEPLRNDAKNLLPAIGATLRNKSDVKQ